MVGYVFGNGWRYGFETVRSRTRMAGAEGDAILAEHDVSSDEVTQMTIWSQLRMIQALVKSVARNTIPPRLGTILKQRQIGM